MRIVVTVDNVYMSPGFSVRLNVPLVTDTGGTARKYLLGSGFWLFVTVDRTAFSVVKEEAGPARVKVAAEYAGVEIAV